MCYGMGCEWENSYGECTAPRSVSKCPHEDVAEPEEVERKGTQWWEEKLKDKDFLWLLGRGKNGDDN